MLVEANLPVKRSDQTYRIGPHIMRWANRFTHETDATTEFATIWDESNISPGATITLSVLEGAEVTYLAARDAAQPAGYNFRIGMRLPAVFTPTGQCFLSHVTNSDVRCLVGDNFPNPLAEHSVRSIEELLDEGMVAWNERRNTLVAKPVHTDLASNLAITRACQVTFS